MEKLFANPLAVTALPINYFDTDTSEWQSKIYLNPLLLNFFIDFHNKRNLHQIWVAEDISETDIRINVTNKNMHLFN